MSGDKGPKLRILESIADNPEARRLFVRAARSSLKVYRQMMEAGVPEEEAKYVLIMPFASLGPETGTDDVDT